MRLPRPTWVGDDDRLPLRYLWDDTRASLDFTADAQPLLLAAGPLSTRARMALCIALFEWTVWRFEGLHEDPVPQQFLVAAWCASADPRWMPFFELERDAWLGPVRGPLWCGITWLRAAVCDGDRKPYEVVDGLQYLHRLAMHVAPRPEHLVRWLGATLPRLQARHPHVPDDPFTDLLGRRLGDHRGPVVVRDEFDPFLSEDALPGPGWLSDLVRTARQAGNPFVLDAAYDFR